MTKKKHTTGKSVGKNIGFTLMTIVLIGMTTVAICGMAFAVYINKYITPSTDIDLDAFRLNLTSFIYYVDSETGEEVQLEALHGVENRVWAGIDEIPDILQKAFISVEDARFESHHGVDWKRTIGASINHVVQFRSNFGGGSTITQQLIKNITGNDTYSVKRKIQEIMTALELEKKYSKDDILELYLNTIYFGQGAYGVKQAANVYFGKELKDLSIAECAAIAGITKNPYKYDIIRFPEYNKERRAVVLKEMKRYNNITQAEFDQAKAAELTTVGKGGNSDESYQSYFVDAVIDSVITDLSRENGYSENTAKMLLYGGGLKVVATIDPQIQAAMDSVFTDTENFPGVLGKDGTYPQAAMTIMDPYTGHVKALYGGRGAKEGDRVLNRATKTYRSPGSAIKPISVYAPGLEYGEITPISVIDDVPKDFTIRASGWPKNENNVYGGLTTIYSGIARSLNTVAIGTLDKVGLERSFNFAKTNMGLTSLVEQQTKIKNDGTQQVYSDKSLGALGLGGLTNGVTVLEMTAAYSAFTNNGVYTEPVLYTKVYDANGNTILDNAPTQTVAMSQKTSTYMLELLKNVVSGPGGTGRRAALDGMEVGGKTGTTTSDNDRWFAGITPYYTGVVWFGYDHQQAIKGVGPNPALYLWHEVMAKVHTGLEPAKLKGSVELQSVSYCADSGLIPNEWCSKDMRGSRVLIGKLAPEDIPKQTCDLHVPVTLDTTTNAIAKVYCPKESVKTVGALNLRRGFNYEAVYVTDQSCCLPYLISQANRPAGPYYPVTPTILYCGAHTAPKEPIAPVVPPKTDPDEPKEPIEPVVPPVIDPTEPIDPTVPTEPIEPTDPTNPEPNPDDNEGDIPNGYPLG